ncbi:MAG: hypothetical protein ACYTGV_04200 [Planctomycetota bacterium]|jgi:hypothetical protein
MRRFILGAALGCLLCLSTSVPATTLPTATTADRVRRAARVCCARCLKVEARIEPRTGLVFTYVELKHLEDLKGVGTEATVRLRIVGGRVGNLETRVPGMPRFRAGEESVLFLGDRNRDGHPVVVDAGRGVLPIRADKRGRRHLVRRVTGMEELGNRRQVTLDEFRAAVRRLVRAQAKERAKR